jgi:hypothetical protein
MDIEISKTATLLGLYADLRQANKLAGAAIRSGRPGHPLAKGDMVRFLEENRKVSELIRQIKAMESA